MGSRLDANSHAVRKRIENHDFHDEAGEEYEPSKFGGFSDYFRRKKIKLQNLDADIRATSGDCPQIFRGVVAHVNGYTQPSLQDLHRIIVSHGGGFLQYLDGKTAATHIIASSLTPKKCEEFRRYRIVKPAWVTESVAAGRLLPWHDYRVVDEGQSQRVLKFGDAQFTSQANTPRGGYRDQSKSSWYNSQLKSVPVADTRDDTSSDMPTTPSRPTRLGGMADEHRSMTSQATQSDYGEFPSFETLDGQDKSEAKEETSAPQNANDVPGGPALPSSGVLTPRNVRTRNTGSQTPQRPTETMSPGKQMSPASLQMTSEEYNAQLLADPRMRKSSVVNPEFLQQYYRESRLHHLSTWKADLKAQLQAATREKALSGTTRRRPVPGARRYVLHVDFDSFFASVSILKHPELREKPVAIAHGSGSGSEIASCNYVARAQGVKNGMWMKSALQSCPNLQVLPYDFPAYEDASRKFYNAVLSVDGVVQSVSIDEALLDVSNQCLDAAGSDGKCISEGSIYREQAKADQIAQSLRDSIKEKTGCAVSVGIGGNILLAKVALRKAKPAGQFHLKPDDVLGFIGNLTVQDLPGVGYSLGSKLEEIGVKYVKDARELTKERLCASLGPKTGTKIWEYARGIDKTEVGNEVIRKSVSAEVNWGIRFTNQDQAEDFIKSLCEELARRLAENLVRGRQLTLKVMRRALDAPLEPVKHLGHGKCDIFNKSVVLGVATIVPDVLGKEAVSMLRSLNFSPGDLRGLGVQMTKLEPLKNGPSTAIEGSQRQLNFFKSPSRKSVPAAEVDPDELESPRKGDSVRIQVDPVLSNSAHKPLNISGSQFIMPTQADPKVISELPVDIRARLVAQVKPSARSPRSGSPCPPPRRQGAETTASAPLPPQSQLDPETLAALPEDVRNEVLGYYNQQPAPTADAQPVQAFSNTSTGVTRRGVPPGGALMMLKRPVTPPKRRRGRPPKYASATNRALTRTTTAAPRVTTTTSSVVSRGSGRDSMSRQQSPALEEESEVSEDFLAALPEDIRQEVIEEQRRSRLRKARASAAVAARPVSQPQNSSSAGAHLSAPAAEKTVPLPPLPARPVFTSRRLSDLPDLRNAVKAWHSAFTAEGPYVEDVEVLCTYLRRVISDEHDIDKAVSVVRWLMWLVSEDMLDRNRELTTSPPSGQGEQGTVTWNAAIGMMQQSVQATLEGRNIPPVDFD
ncbi:hypothetical protein N7539_000821 [Penicillium diatomitis]|uniref:DNA repair protein REV1 n=1 Tax=Penicillium diatomitis TaxID=2819901 RepID=A0A9W9XN89_9EURO|nr:uncharacterized protein N7539_000821 [Penicillium diatomitis]KAJ5495705.1 hypothetical protein N7539_000821 [Penicillium diatomitis]